MKSWENLKSNGVLIGATHYSIQEVDNIVIDGQECGGSLDSNFATIEIGKFIGDGAKVKFLMHEIIHGILQSRGMYELNENEDVIDALSEGFITLIRDNPDLVSFLYAGN